MIEILYDGHQQPASRYDKKPVGSPKNELAVKHPKIVAHRPQPQAGQHRGVHQQQIDQWEKRLGFEKNEEGV